MTASAKQVSYLKSLMRQATEQGSVELMPRYEIVRTTPTTPQGETIAWGLTEQEALDGLQTIGAEYEDAAAALERRLSPEWAETVMVPHVDWAGSDRSFCVEYETWVTGQRVDSSAYGSWRVREDGGVASHPAEPSRSYPR